MLKKSRRRPAGPQETRKRLLEAGLKLFAEHGYKGVTTRQLAEKAGVNQAAIPYHFGGKEGLYLAIAGRIATALEQLVEHVVSRSGYARSPAKASRAELARTLVFLVHTIAGRMALFGDMRYERTFVLKEYALPGKGFHVIFQGARAMHELVTEVVAAAQGLDPKSEEAILRAHTVMGQVMGFGVGKAVLCTRLGCEEYDEELRGRIASVAADMVLRAVGLENDYQPEDKSLEA